MILVVLALADFQILEFFSRQVAVIVNNDQADTTTNPIAANVTTKEVLNRFI